MLHNLSAFTGTAGIPIKIHVGIPALTDKLGNRPDQNSGAQACYKAQMQLSSVTDMDSVTTSNPTFDNDQLMLSCFHIGGAGHPSGPWRIR